MEKGVSMFGETKQPYLTPKWVLKKDITDWIIEEGKKGRWDVSNSKTDVKINQLNFLLKRTI